MTNSDLSQFQTARSWLAKRPNPIFRTMASLEWFIRQNRDELIQSGEMIVRRGSAGTLVGPGFDAVVMRILRRKSAVYEGGAE